MLIKFAGLAIVALILMNVKALDLTATMVAFVFGVLIWELHGAKWFIVLLTFLVMALLATHFNSAARLKPKHMRREVDNVLSNGLVAFMTALFAASSVATPEDTLIFLYVYLGSISAALADTLSSEIGIFSPTDPVLITHPLTRVEPGTNGGISIMGTMSGFVAAFMLALLAETLFGGGLRMIFAVTLAGAAGTLFDSFLGATLENRGLMTNGSVNFMTTMLGGLTCVLLMYI